MNTGEMRELADIVQRRVKAHTEETRGPDFVPRLPMKWPVQDIQQFGNGLRDAADEIDRLRAIVLEMYGATNAAHEAARETKP